MNVEELINELKKMDKDKPVKISVNWDNCDHIQELESIHDFQYWVILIGDDND